jgi:O-antigen ligase
LHPSPAAAGPSFEGADTRSLLILFAAALFLLAASAYTERWIHWAGVVLLLFSCGRWRALPGNALSALVLAYAAWHLVNAVFISPVHASEAIYQPLMLLGGFVAFATAGRARAAAMFKAGTALMAGLSMMGLAQHWFGIGYLQTVSDRAVGTFITPNTLASALVMFLVPLAALYVAGGQTRVLWAALALFSGLVATQSRGGMLAGLAGLGFVALCFGPAVLRARWRKLLTLLVGGIAAWMIVAAIAALAAPLATPDLPRLSATDAWLARGVAERPFIYGATLEFILQRPFAGYGANMFYPLFESVKTDDLRSSIYYYAHDDYLQEWLEFGAPGVLMLIAIVLLSLATAFRGQRSDPADSLPVACGGGLAACFAHSIVDFPLYVPFLLMVVGAFLGTLSAHSGILQSRQEAFAALRRTPHLPLASGALLLAVLAWLAEPVGAELALEHAVRRVARGDVSDGLYWQSVARRLQPRQPAFYWYEGQTWEAQAVHNRNTDQAAQADALYAEGHRVQPYDVGVLLARAHLHRQHSDLLRRPASPEEVLGWATEAVALRPRNVTARAEYAYALEFAGRREEAREVARGILAQYPDSAGARRLAADLGLQGG